SRMGLAPPHPVRTNAMFADAFRYRRVTAEMKPTMISTNTPLPQMIERDVSPSSGMNHAPTAIPAPTRKKMNGNMTDSFCVSNAFSSRRELIDGHDVEHLFLRAISNEPYARTARNCRRFSFRSARHLKQRSAIVAHVDHAELVRDLVYRLT